MKLLVWSGMLLLFGSECLAQTQGTVDYGSQVQTVVAAKCVACHGQQRRDGGLSLATYDAALEGGRSGATIKPGNSAASLLVQRITGELQPRMPLGGKPLSDAEIATIRSWIDEGARATPKSAPAKPKWEPPLSLTSPAVPEQTWSKWSKPVDRFVAAYLKTNNTTEPLLVSDRQFARRAYLDILGLLPDPTELQAFVSDAAPDKREQLIRRLLDDSDKYAEHWISFWNDLLRNDEGVNYFSETASRRSITKWLLASLKSNLPFDQFVSRLLNPIETDDPHGFLIGVNWRGTINASQTPAMQAAQNTSQIFLGINLKCNACHDSFISRWKLKQAYSMASYFSAEKSLQLFRCDVAQKEYAEPAFLYPELNREPASGSLADRRAAAASIFTDSRNGRLPRTLVNRVWQRLLGHGLVSDPDDMDAEPWNAALLDWLASDFVEHKYDLKHLVATIISSRAYQMPAIAAPVDSPRQYTFRGPEIRRLSAEQFADAIGAITGEWHVYQPPAPKTQAAPNAPAPPAVYTREWRVAASPLTRALGRPIRDQVYSTRETQATTLQALELVNGEALTHWLARGARKMLGELPPEPASLFDRAVRGRAVLSEFDVDISGSDKLWLLVQDAGSYSPEKVEAAWAGVELVGPRGTTRLASLKPLDDSGIRAGTGPVVLGRIRGHGVRVKTPSRLIYDIAGLGYTRLRGIVGIENKELSSDINPQLRLFVFRDEPNMERLTPVAATTPLPAAPTLKSTQQVVDRIFHYALGRAPTAEERGEAERAVNNPERPGHPCWEGVADLLWAVMMKPEFQLIY